MIEMLMAAAAAASPVPVSASIQDDAFCFTIYAAALGSSDDEKVQTSGTAGLMYFLGRLDHAGAAADMTRLLSEQAAKLDGMEEAQATRLGDACDKRFEAVGQRLTVAGTALTAGAKAKP